MKTIKFTRRSLPALCVAGRGAGGLSAAEKSVLVHSLCGSSRERKVYRNWFSADACHDDMPHIKRLMKLGLMVGGRSDPVFGTYYHVTAEGAAAVGLSLEGMNR